MKIVNLSVGGKTFVAGEYLALTGGPALMLSTDPRFELEVYKDGGSEENIFHPQSPAGKFWNLHSDYFNQYHLNFKDPYKVGGFGASSAQFALLHSLWQLKNDIFNESERFFDWGLMLKDYRQIAAQATGFPPSGADVVGAVTGGLTWFDRNHGKVQAFSWPFFEVDFFVAHTGNKLATHEHLQSLQSFETGDFEAAMAEINKGLTTVQFDHFLNGLKAYRAALKAQSRVIEDTDQRVQNLEKNSEVLFAKGCGAMGSDVILVLCDKKDTAKVREIIQKENLKIVAETAQISRSLHIQNIASGQQDLSL